MRKIKTETEGKCAFGQSKKFFAIVLIGLFASTGIHMIKPSSAFGGYYAEISLGEIAPVVNNTGLEVYDLKLNSDILNLYPRRNLTFQFTQTLVLYNPGDELQDRTFVLPLLLETHYESLKFQLEQNGEMIPVLLTENWEYIAEQIGEEYFYNYYYNCGNFFMFFNSTIPAYSISYFNFELSFVIPTKDRRPDYLYVGYHSESPNVWGKNYTKRVDFIVEGIQPRYYSSYTFEEYFSNTTLAKNKVLYSWQIDTAEIDNFHLYLSFKLPQKITNNFLFVVVVITGILPFGILLFIVLLIRLFYTLYLLKKDPSKLVRFRKALIIKLGVLLSVVLLGYIFSPFLGLGLFVYILPYFIHLTILLKKNS